MIQSPIKYEFEYQIPNNSEFTFCVLIIMYTVYLVECLFVTSKFSESIEFDFLSSLERQYFTNR